MIAAKPHKDYAEQLNLLLERGMVIADRDRAIRKLSQVGYYRLSGFWYTSRLITTNDEGLSRRTDNFLEGTTFEHAYDLYMFDKNLRLLMIDALERIEINVRSVIAHEVGRTNPLAYKMRNCINPRFLNGENSVFDKWSQKQEQKISESRDDCISWHIQQQKEIPFWVAVETWDFGQMSKYYSMLNGYQQSKIVSRFGLDNKRMFERWLACLNLLRNRCAHHSRIWNRKYSPIIVPDNDYFRNVRLSEIAKERLFGVISVIWFLVKQIGPNSTWLRQVANLIDEKPMMPGCEFHAMGIPGQSFPRDRFGADLGLMQSANDSSVDIVSDI